VDEWRRSTINNHNPQIKNTEFNPTVEPDDIGDPVVVDGDLVVVEDSPVLVEDDPPEVIPVVELTDVVEVDLVLVEDDDDPELVVDDPVVEDDPVEDDPELVEDEDDPDVVVVAEQLRRGPPQETPVKLQKAGNTPQRVLDVKLAVWMDKNSFSEEGMVPVSWLLFK